MIGRFRIFIERVDLVKILGVVRSREPEILVESADDGERAADPEVAVEIDDALHGHMRFVIPRGPLQMRITKQYRLPRLSPARCECPCIRTVVTRGSWPVVR